MANNASELDMVVVGAYLNRGPYLDGIERKDLFKSPLGIPFSFEVHASINGFYRYGSITFDDRFGIRESLPLTGNEIISIVYKNATRGAAFTGGSTVIHFNIFDMEETQIYPDQLSKFTEKAIKFHLIEAPFFLKYNDTVWSRSFGKNTGQSPAGISIDEIFRKHLQDDLQIDKNNIVSLKLEKMATKTHFCCPSWKSQMMFSYLLDFARDDQNYGNVKLYNTSDNEGGVIINLKSINQMITSTDRKAVEFVLADSSTFLSNSVGLAQKNLNQIISHKFLSYDITSIPTGLPGGQLLTYDYIGSRYYTLKEKYDQAIQKKENPFFHPFALWSEKISNDKSKQIYSGQYPKDYAKSYLNNKLIEQNKHQLRCQTMTYIDEQVQPGDKIFIVFLSGTSNIGKTRPIMDEQMSGYWIVEEIVDAAANGRGVRNMTLVRDSFVNLYTVTSGPKPTKTLPTVNNVSTTNQ
jgi:hypothetical protein